MVTIDVPLTVLLVFWAVQSLAWLLRVLKSEDVASVVASTIVGAPILAVYLWAILELVNR